MPAPVLQFKRGNAGVAGTVPALRPGEPAISLNNFDFFIGIDTSVVNNKFFGSHRYWEREDGTNSLKLKLVSNNGSESVNLRAPTGLGATVTYTLPGIQGAVSSVLTNDGSGNLTWASGSANPVFSGIATFTDTTDNTLGLYNTGAVQIEGGLGVQKNVTVGAGLSVAGESYFIGTATFYGGQINLGDSDGDNINVAGEFVSNLVPNTDNTYDIGDNATPKRWRNAAFSGVGTFATGLVADSVRLGIGGAGSVDTTTGNLTLDSASGLTVINDNLQVEGDVDIDFNLNVDGHSELDDVNVSGVSTFVGVIDANGGLDVTGHSELDDVNVSGIATIANLDVQTDFDIYAPTATFHDNVIIEGNLTVNGTETIINTQSLNVTDKEIILGLGTNGSPSDASASGGGIAIASTEGNPLVDFNIVGIHTHPNTYKDIVWIRADDLGVGTTDAWHFNYAVGIGSTQVLNGVRFAVTNTQITDSTLSTPQINVSGASTIGGSLDVSGGLLVVGITTIGSGVGVTQFTSDVGSGTSTSSVPTSSAVIEYVRTADFGIAGDSGTGNVNMDHTFTISGTANEIETLASGQTITIGLPDAVVVGTSLSTPTIRTNLIKSSDANSTVFTLSNDDASLAGDLTVGGNLYVNGSTTQVNTTTLTIEDTLVELGLVDGSVPGSDLNKDLGLLFNYFSGTAKKAAVFWDDSENRIVFADDVTESSGVLTVASNAYASIEIESLWVNDCAGQSQVITCSGSERFLQNITVDAGEF
jgi:hypothetical protein